MSDQIEMFPDVPVAGGVPARRPIAPGDHVLLGLGLRKSTRHMVAALLPNGGLETGCGLAVPVTAVLTVNPPPWTYCDRCRDAQMRGVPR